MDILDKLKNEQNAAGRSHLSLDAPEMQSVSIRPQKQVTPGMFKADPFLPGGYIAHPITIRALKKDIFAAGENIDLLSQPHTCASCQKRLDLQFWHFCPYCEKSFPSTISKG